MSSQSPWDEPTQYQPTQYQPYASPSGSDDGGAEQPPPPPYPQPGYPVAGYPPPPYQQPPPVYGYPAAYNANAGTNGLAIASLVCSLLVCGPLGVIFGHIAQSQIKRTGERGSGLALAGVIIGYIGVALLLIYAVAVIAVLASGDYQ